MSDLFASVYSPLEPVYFRYVRVLYPLALICEACTLEDVRQVARK